MHIPNSLFRLFVYLVALELQSSSLASKVPSNASSAGCISDSEPITSTSASASGNRARLLHQSERIPVQIPPASSQFSQQQPEQFASSPLDLWTLQQSSGQASFQNSPYFSQFLAASRNSHPRANTESDLSSNFQDARQKFSDAAIAAMGVPIDSNWIDELVHHDRSMPDQETMGIAVTTASAAATTPTSPHREISSNPASIFDYHGAPKSGSASFNTEESSFKESAPAKMNKEADSEEYETIIQRRSRQRQQLADQAQQSQLLSQAQQLLQVQGEEHHKAPLETPKPHHRQNHHKKSSPTNRSRKSLKTESVKPTTELQTVDDSSSSRKPRSNSLARNPANPADICKVVSRSFDSSSDVLMRSRLMQYQEGGPTLSAPSSNAQQSNQPPTHKPPIVKAKAPESKPALTAPPAPSIPSNAVPVENWEMQFRMPQAYAAPPGSEIKSNVFRFPGHRDSDPAFLEQLKAFRKSIRHYRGNLIDDKSCRIEDFTPKFNLIWDDKTRLTDSPPIKVFNAPPLRQWIPMRCDALRYDFRVFGPVDGHAGKAGGRTLVSIVYDAKKGDSVKYIMKEYYDVEYFTNEYNFFQFANHIHLPKPICVEYGANPKIVMEFVEGERVSQAFYELGMDMQKKHPNKFNDQWAEIIHNAGLVFGMLLATIKYIHSIGFIHADIKPENVIYNIETNQLYVIDFDLSVSAPYVFTGRGTHSTVAPEVHGLLKGPVHFAIDWWAYGSTVVIIIASGMAGVLYDIKERSVTDSIASYIPFFYNQKTNSYTMTPLPNYFPLIIRSFIYPFFNPDPSRRVFSEFNAYNWIRTHPTFTSIQDWGAFERKVHDASLISPLMHGFVRFSRRPVLLAPIKRFQKTMSSFFNIGGFFGSNTVDPEPLADSKIDCQDSDSDESSGEDEGSSSCTNRSRTSEMFQMDDNEG